METYRQKELFRTELLKQIVNLDAMGVRNILEMNNPYSDLNITFGLRMVHEALGSDSRLNNYDNMCNMSIELLIGELSRYESSWCAMTMKVDALGSIAIELWNAGMDISIPNTIGLMAYQNNIPFSKIRRLDALLSKPDAIKMWAKTWYPNKADLETLLDVPYISSHLDEFLISNIHGRFARDLFEGTFREGNMSWCDVFRWIISAGADGSRAWEVYNKLSKRHDIDDGLTAEDFQVVERPRKRPRA